MATNKYKFIFNQNQYIIGFNAVIEGQYDFEGQMSEYPNATRGWTKFQSGALVEDQVKKQQILAEETKQARISELKQKLQETDYIYNSIREGGRTEEYYAEVIENRKAWRREIQELEGDI